MAVEALIPADSWLAGATAPSAIVNDNARRLEVALLPALSFEATQPGSPVDGALFILSADWGAGVEHDLAYYFDGAWTYWTPFEGQVKDVGGSSYQFDGAAWVPYTPGAGSITLTGDVTGSGTGTFATTLATAQPAVHTWALAQTFTVAPVFTDASGTRTALGLGTAAVQGIGTSGATVPLLSTANTWTLAQTHTVAPVVPGITGPAGSTSLNVSQPTSDGSDTARSALMGASAMNNTRGAWVEVSGNEHASTPGLARVAAGAGADIELNTSGAGYAKLTQAPSAGDTSLKVASTAFVRTPSLQSVTSASTVTPTFDNDAVKVTALAAACQLLNPTGTAIPFHGIAVRIKDNGTARALTYDTQYRAVGVTLPTTTVISKTLYLGMIYNDTDTKWDVVAVAQEA